jgi:beta-lactamase regulating signal transducer with metallopeptidase domain
MFMWLLHNTILAGLLALGVAALCQWRKCGPALRHSLWLLVLLRLLLPPGVMSWPWAVPFSLGREAPKIEVVAATAAPVTWVVERDVAVVEAAAGTAEKASPIEPATHEVVAPTSIDWSAWAWRMGVGAWALGAAIVALLHLRGLVRIIGLVRTSDDAPPWLHRRVADMSQKLGISPPRVRVLDDLPSPLVAGLLRPVLLWPRQLQDRLDEDGLKAVLVHELAHLRRHDHWVRWAEMLAACVWWWNPLFRLARRRIRRYAELACDAWVVAVLPKARRAYAEALLQVCEHVTRAAEPAAALGVGGDRDDFQRRLTMIMRESVACRVPRKALLAVGVLALLTIPGWSLGDPPAEPDDGHVVATEDPSLGVLLSEDLKLDVDVLNKLLSATADGDRDKKLEELEAQIQAILKEIKALKAEKARGSEAPKSDARAEAEKRARAEVARALAQVDKAKIDVEKALAEAAKKLKEDLPERKEALAKLAAAQELMQKELAGKAGTIRSRALPADGKPTQARYSLPHDKAEALAGFLRENAKGSFSECTVEGDRLIVTAPTASQQTIARLVRLIREPAGEKK